MNWRWVVLAIGGLALLDTLLGVAVYTSKSWDFSHTEVLTGWPAVREYCLIQFPIAMVVAAFISGLATLGVHWAVRGDR